MSIYYNIIIIVIRRNAYNQLVDHTYHSNADGLTYRRRLHHRI